MTRFKLDMHIHTSEVSKCGEVPAEKMVRLYKDLGYQAVMVTDHFHKQYFDSLGNISWEEKVERYLQGYRKAKTAGSEIGLTVLLGIEFRNTESDNDFLIIGITEKFLKDHPYIYTLSLKEAIDLFHKNGLLVIQAHPQRIRLAEVRGSKVYMGYKNWEMIEILKKHPRLRELPFKEGMPIRPENIGKEGEIAIMRVCSLQCEDYIDGIEVFNGNYHWMQREEEIFDIIQKHPEYIQISSSDFHEPGHAALGGVVLNRSLSTSEELVEVLKEKSIIERIQHIGR